ncbi:MAG: ATP-binding protein [Candidatus Promineifilaceae bacterium]
MIQQTVLVVTPHQTQWQRLVALIAQLEKPYTLTYAASFDTMSQRLADTSADRCIIAAELLTQASFHLLHAEALFKRTIIIGRADNQQATVFLQQGALDYIDEQQIDCLQLQLALERPIPMVMASPQSLQLKTLVENAHSIHALLDRHGKIDYLNPIGIATLGNISTLKQFCNGVCGKDSHESIQLLLTHAREQGVWQTEVSYQTSCDEPARDLLVRIIPLRHSPNSSLLGYGLLAHDVTLIRAATRESEKSTAKMIALYEQKTAFMMALSHELRSPLATILTSSELLHTYWAAISVEKRVNRLQRIKQQVVRMVDLLDEVLLIDRLDNETAYWRVEPIDLNQLVHESVNDLREQHVESHCYVVEGRISAEFTGNPSLLRRAVSNLLTNATKYSPDGGEIHIQLNNTHKHLQISVHDQGIGIPIEDLPNLFSQFHRARNTGRLPGTGLGLAITKRAVEMHQGTITVHSTEGVGTSFTISLPKLIEPALAKGCVSFE